MQYYCAQVICLALYLFSGSTFFIDDGGGGREHDESVVPGKTYNVQPALS